MPIAVVKLELPRGMRDLEPDDLAGIYYVRDKFLETARLFNFKIMEPSPLEMLSTLEAKSGTAISSEIYAFKDKGDREIALRFDLTIGMTRYVALRRDLKMPAKVASFAGVWRYDEPQAGRYRYFHQWDVEIYGPFSLESDAEVIEFVYSFFGRLGLKVSIEVNDRQLIEQYITEKLGITDREEIIEMFRAVDKVPKKGAQAVLQEYSGRIDPAKLKMLIELSSVRGSVDDITSRTNVRDLAAWKNLEALVGSLANRKVENVRVNLGIVRGLDYYSGIVFEAFDESDKGAALVGGGRYDRLTEAFGRKDLGATGVAGGVERIVLALRRQGVLGLQKTSLVYVACTGDELRPKLMEIVTELRGAGFAIEYDLVGKQLRKQLDDASGRQAAAVVIIAPEELKEDKVIVRSMQSGAEEKHQVSGLKKALDDLLRS